MRPLFIGKDEEGREIELGEEDLGTHVHGVGASRTGKSKLIEWIARELIRNHEGFCLIDPHGFLYEDLVAWLAYLEPKREVVLFNPSAEGRVVGFNPFRRRPGDLTAQVDRLIRATLKAWGEGGGETRPRLERWLRCLYYTLAAGDYSVVVAPYLFSWEHREIRERLVAAVDSELIRNEWGELAAYARVRDFAEQLESTRNRLFRFLGAQQIRRMMGLSINNIDLGEIIESGKILLVNLQPSGVLTEQNAALVGTLLLHELWQVGMRRTREQARKRFFVVIDEFQKFLTPDVGEMLNEAAKYGLHLCLFHQHLGQLRERDPEAYGAAMTNARIKLVFGGLAREDALTMVREIFPGQIDLKRIKFLIEQTKFWPVYTRDKIWSSGRGGSRTAGTVAGETWNPNHEEWIPSGSVLESESESWQEGEVDVPIFYPVPFKEVSSITAYTLEETLWELADRLMEQYQRHFFIRRPGGKTVAAVAPWVQPRYVTEKIRARYIERQLAGFLTVEDVDHALLEIVEGLGAGIGLRGDALSLPDLGALGPEDFYPQKTD